MIKICPTVCDMDKNVAKKLDFSKIDVLWTPRKVSLYRAILQQKEILSSNFTEDELYNAILQYFDDLMTQQKQQSFNEIKNMFSKKHANSSKVFSDLYKEALKVFDGKKLSERVSLICRLFSDRITEIQDAYRNAEKESQRLYLFRSQIANGVRFKDGMHYGQFELFESVYDSIIYEMAEISESLHDDIDQKTAEKLQQQYNEFEKIIENWTLIATLARQRLKTTEKIILGNFEDYSLQQGEDDIFFEESEYDPEVSTKEAYQEEKDKRSAFGSLTSEVRLAFSQCSIGKEDDLGFDVMANPIEIHQILIRALDGAKTWKQMKKVLDGLEYPWMQSLKEKLNNDSNFRAQFVVNMRKGKQFYSILLQGKTVFSAAKTKILNIIKNQTSNQYKKTFLSLDSSIKYNIDFEKLKALQDNVNKKTGTTTYAYRVSYLNDLFDLLHLDKNDIIIDQLAQEYWSNFRRDPIQSSINGLIKRGEELIKSNKDHDIRSMLTGKEYALSNAITSIGNIVDDALEIQYERRVSHKGSKNKSSSYDSMVDPSFMTDLIGGIKYFVKNNDSKGLYNFIKDKYLCSSYFYIRDTDDNGTIIDDLENASTIKLDNILNTWIRELVASCIDEKGKFVEQFNENSFAGKLDFNRFLGERGLDFSDYTAKQHMTALVRFFNSLYETSNKKNDQWGMYPTFILGDSGAAKFITSRVYNIKDPNNKAFVLDQLYNVFRQELQRLSQEETFRQSCRKNRIIFKKSHFDRKNKFDELYKDLNLEETREKALEWAEESAIPNKIIEQLKEAKNKKEICKILEDSKPTFTMLPFLNEEAFSHINKYSSEAEVKAAIEAHMQSAVQEFKQKIQNLGLLEKNGEVYYNLGQDIKDSNLDEHLENYYWNTKLALINQMQFFVLDTGAYVNTKDLQKRYKEIHASGIALDLDTIIRESPNREGADKMFEKSLYFEDIEIPGSKFTKFDYAIAYNFGLEELGESAETMSTEEIVEAGRTTLKYAQYKKNSLTDGQGYRSLTSYRKLSKAFGKWTDQHEYAYNKIMKIREKGTLTNEDIVEISRLSAIFQPIKPFLYTHEQYNLDGNNIQLIGVQHKYAEVVLIPELLPEGSMLRDMAEYMENEDIDTIVATTVVKTGMFGQTNIYYETDDSGEILKDDNNNPIEISTKEGLEKALKKAYIHKLNYSDYRIQTNVPYHLSEEQLFGTQIRKLILANLDLGHEYDYIFSDNENGNRLKIYEGEELSKLTGRNLTVLYNSLIMANILETFDVFANTVKDAEKLSEKFIQNVISNSRQSIDNILAFSLTENEQFLLPLFEGLLEHDSASTLFSLFKKAVLKQKMSGGSAVQASALGISGYEKDGNLQYVTDPNDDTNILYAECEVTFDFYYTTVTGEKVKLKFEDYCHNDGTLKLDKSEELDIKDPKNRLYQSYYEIDSEGNKHYYKPLIEKDYPNILSIIAYRIPTERAYSTINLRVKKFSLPINGGIIRVPAQGTTVAGFDFDIDKLYLMYKQFTEQNPFYENYDFKRKEGDSKEVIEQKREDVKNIYEQIHKNHPELLNTSERTEIDYSENVGDIYLKFYDEHPNIYYELKLIKDRLGNKDTKLVELFDKSKLVKDFAQKNGMTIPELQKWIVTEYGQKYFFGKEVIVYGDKKYSFKEGISKEQKTKAFEEAAEQLGIQLKVNKNSRFIKYDYSKLPQENKRIARNNLLLEIMQNRLMDKETFLDRYTPGGFVKTSRAAKLNREIEYGDIEDLLGINIPTSVVKGENISENNKDSFLKNIANSGNQKGFIYKQDNINKSYNNVQEAYDDLKWGATHKEENYKLMINLLSAKLREHNDLYEGIKQRGGLQWISQCTCDLKDQFFGSGEDKENKFIDALQEAYKNIAKEKNDNIEEYTPIDTRSIRITERELDILNSRVNDRNHDAEPNYDPSDIMTIIEYNQQNQVAAKLIGIFANQNANHAISSLLRSFSLIHPIEFMGHSYKDFLNHKDEYGNSIDVTGNLAELVAASVDAVKDPTLKFLNLNTLTADAGAMLVRLGYSIEEVGILFNQPIIKELCNYAFTNGCSLSVAINQMYKNKFENIPVDDKDAYKYLTKEVLIANQYKNRINKLQTPTSDIEYTKGQAHVLKLFEKITKVSQDFTNYIQTTRYTASNSVKSTFGDMYEQQYKVDKYMSKMKEGTLPFVIEVTAESDEIKTIDNDIRNLELSNSEYIKKLAKHPFAYEQCMFDMNRKMLKLFDKYFPYEKNLYKQARGTLAAYTHENRMLANTINLLHRDLPIYILSNMDSYLNQNFNRVYQENPGDDVQSITSEQYYNEKLIKKVAAFKKEYKGNNDFIMSLNIMTDSSGYDYISIPNILQLSQEQKESLTENWLSLWQNSETRQLAEDLFMYCLYNNGTNYSYSSFASLAPTLLKQNVEVAKHLTYSNFLQFIMGGSVPVRGENAYNDFIKQFMLNHTELSELWYYPNAKIRRSLQDKMFVTQENGTQKRVSEISFTQEQLEDMPGFSKIIKGQEDEDLISCRTGFYMTTKLGDTEVTSYFIIKNMKNVLSAGEPIVYERVEPQGKTNVFVRYKQEQLGPNIEISNWFTPEEVEDFPAPSESASLEAIVEESNQGSVFDNYDSQYEELNNLIRRANNIGLLDEETYQSLLEFYGSYSMVDYKRFIENAKKKEAITISKGEDGVYYLKIC